MPISGFLSLPGILGESSYTQHENEIEIHSIDWGVAFKAASKLGRGRTAAKSKIRALGFHKMYDASSPYLALASMQGKSLEEAVLSVRKDSGEAHLDYLVITMTNVMVKSYEILRSQDDMTELEERVSLSFEKVAIKYTVQADNHSAGDEHEIEYDIAAGV